MWPFTPKTVYDKYKKLIQLLISIDPKYMEITKNEENEVIIQSNREGDFIVDFTLYRNFKFRKYEVSNLTTDYLLLNVFYIIEDESGEINRSYHKSEKQENIFNNIMIEVMNKAQEITFRHHKDEITAELEKMKLLYDMFVK